MKMAADESDSLALSDADDDDYVPYVPVKIRKQLEVCLYDKFCVLIINETSCFSCSKNAIW